MTIVTMGRKWEIKTREDYEKALDVLEANEFCARMTDDFRRGDMELDEIRRQFRDVARQAVALGII